MPVLLSEEEIDKDRPVLFFYTNDKAYAKPFFLHYQDNFKLLVISSSKPQLQSPFYFLSTSELERYDGIADKVEYGIIHLTTPSDKAYAQRLISLISKRNQIPVVFLIPVRLIADFTDLILQHAGTPRVSFLLLGDIYSIHFKADNSTSKIIEELGSKHSFQIEGNDLEPVFPIAFEDALSGIASILFSAKKKGGVYYLFYKHPQSIATLVQLSKRVEPELRVSYKEPTSFIKRFTTHEEIHQFLYQKLSKRGHYLDSVFEGFEKTIAPFFSNSILSKNASSNQSELQNKSIPKTPLTDEPKKERKIPTKHLKRIALFWTILTAVIIFILFLLGGLIFIQSQSIKKDYERGDFGAITKKASHIHSLLISVDPSIRLGFKVFSLLPFTDELRAEYLVFYDLISLGDTLHQTEQIAKRIPSGLELPEVQQLTRDAVFSYFQAQWLLSRIDRPELLSNKESTQYLAISPLLPDILGYSGKKTYLLLFQNNHELRPTGGFIGTVGTLVLSNGKIESLDIEDVYELDGQLTKHVEPHYIIRKYLQPHLYLRDSNFDINFEESAQKAAQLYALETQKEVDGVIGINYEVLERILTITGPITIGTLNLTFDQDTAFETIQNEIHKDFFPGSTQKKDVLTALFEKIDDEIMGDPNKTSQFLGLFPLMMKEKHILFAFKQASIQKIMSSLNLADDIADYRILDRRTLRDFLFINEANIGSSKVNQYVSREVAYSLDVSKEIPEGVIKIVLENRSPKDDYLSYFRVGLPYKSVVNSISIDGTEQELTPAITDFQVYEDRNYRAPAGLELDNTFQYERQIYGFVHAVPKGKRQIIEIGFSSSLTPRFTSVMSYSLLYQKQPGTQTYPFTFSLKYPNKYNAEAEAISSYGEGSVVFQKDISTDEEINVTLLAKPSE